MGTTLQSKHETGTKGLEKAKKASLHPRRSEKTSLSSSAKKKDQKKAKGTGGGAL